MSKMTKNQKMKKATLSAAQERQSDYLRRVEEAKPKIKEFNDYLASQNLALAALLKVSAQGITPLLQVVDTKKYGEEAVNQ